MNYSYGMGLQNIEKLRQNHFQIESFGENYGITFSDEQIEMYEQFIAKNLQKGFWNEYLGKEIVFLFKLDNGVVKKLILNRKNEDEILKLCCKFAECEFSSVMDMLKDNSFYQNTYFKTTVE